MNHEDTLLAQAIEAKLAELNQLLNIAGDRNLHVELSVDTYHWIGKAEPFGKVNVKIYRTLLDSQHA